MPDVSPTIHCARFADLDPHALYGILQLRSAVFVVEQACVFLEPDGRDSEPDAEHLWVSDEHGIVATARLLVNSETESSIGRIVTRTDARSTGVAGALIRAGLDRLRSRGARRVTIGAQSQLEEWYGRFGFAVSGPAYVEDGIPHVPMALEFDT